MFFFLLILFNNGVQDTIIDSAQVRKYEVPKIVDFTTNSIIDSILIQSRTLEPIIFLNGLKEFIYFTPYLVKDRGWTIELFSPYPVEISLHSHPLNSYFIKNFNFVSLPINFLESMRLSRDFSGDGIERLEMKTKVNLYNQPFSSLYFTLLGGNTIYNLDFTRSVSNYAGLYLSGLYSQQYKIYDRQYLRTNAGYANFYYNQFIPMRIDVVISNNHYDTLNINFNDIAITAGNDKYKISFFRTYDNIKSCDTLGNIIMENGLLSFKTVQSVLFGYKNFENFFSLYSSMDRFTYATDSFLNRKDVEFYQKLNYGLGRFLAGLGYDIDYVLDKNIYFNPEFNAMYKVFDDCGILFRLEVCHNRASYLTEQGNTDIIDKEIIITPNPDIKDERYIFKELGLKFKNTFFSIYHSGITDQIVYERDSNDYYRARNLGYAEASGIEGTYNFTLGRIFSFGGVLNLLLDSPESFIFPEFNHKFWLNLYRITERSDMTAFIRFTYTGDRKDIVGNQYTPFLIVSPGLMVKFITLRTGLIIDNIFDENPPDFPNAGRSFCLEVKWDFWD